ncbi:hypothetical protein Nmel_006021 [Mimus melanotis]
MWCSSKQKYFTDINIQIYFCNCISWWEKKEEEIHLSIKKKGFISTIAKTSISTIAKTSISTQHFQIISCIEIISPNTKIMLNFFSFSLQ